MRIRIEWSSIRENNEILIKTRLRIRMIERIRINERIMIRLRIRSRIRRKINWIIRIKE